MTLNLHKETEVGISSLSGEIISFPFTVWWKEKTENLNIKEATVSFMELLFSFLQKKNCNIVNGEEISNFLNNHISIINYLYEAPDVIRGKFGDVNLNLELVFDPEIEGDEGELFLNIETDLSPKEAVKKLDIIDEEWLLKRASEDIGMFNLSLEFI
jgi:hypothetical protein